MIKSILKTTTTLLLSALLFGCGKDIDSDTPQASISISTTAPTEVSSDSTFQDLSGKPIELADFIGKKVVLNYWATWCAPCIREIPSLVNAANLLKDENFIFLLASDESLEDIAGFIADHEFEANFLKLNSFFATSGVAAVPSTLLYDSKGNTINSWLGEYKWDSPEMLIELSQVD